MGIGVYGWASGLRVGLCRVGWIRGNMGSLL